MLRGPLSTGGQVGAGGQWSRYIPSMGRVWEGSARPFPGEQKQAKDAPTSHFLGFFLLFFPFPFRAAPVAYGGSQARVESELQLPAYTTAAAMWDP